MKAVSVSVGGAPVFYDAFQNEYFLSFWICVAIYSIILQLKMQK